MLTRLILYGPLILSFDMSFIIHLWYSQKVIKFWYYLSQPLCQEIYCKITQHLHYEFMGKVPKGSQLQGGIIFFLEEKELAAGDTEMKKWAKQVLASRSLQYFRNWGNLGMENFESGLEKKVYIYSAATDWWFYYKETRRKVKSIIRTSSCPWS